MFQFQSINGEATFLITPPFSLEFAYKPVLYFWHAQDKWKHGSTYYNDNLSVYYKVHVDSPWVFLVNYPEVEASWTERIIALPLSVKSKTFYLGFKGQTNWGWGTCIDDIQVIETGFLAKSLSTITVQKPPQRPFHLQLKIIPF